MGVMFLVFMRNSVLPTKRSEIFSTAVDNQPTMSIRIFEGERPMAKDNHLIATFGVRNIPPAPRGTPQIEVTFEIDLDGILHVSVHRFTPKEIEQVQKEYDEIIRLEEIVVDGLSEAKDKVKQLEVELERAKAEVL